MEKFPKIGEAVAAVANWRRRRYIDWAFNFEKHLTYELSTWLQDYSNTKICG